MRLWVFAFLIVALPLAAGAQQTEKPSSEKSDPTETPWSAEKVDQPPARETNMKHVDEPLKLVLFQADPQLLMQKYTAVVRVHLPAQQFGPSIERSQSTGLHWLLQRGGSRWYPKAPPLAEQFKTVMEVIPKDRLPPPDARAFFVSDDIAQRFLVMPFDEAKSYREVRILAPTAEDAEKRAETFLFLADQGLTRPLQVSNWMRREEYVAKWKAAHAAIEEAEGQLAELDSAAKALSDFPADIGSALRVQQLQLEVDRAGVQARIAAATKLLETTKGETRQAVENAKVAAEIELAGFDARQAKADEIIAKVTEKTTLLERMERAKGIRSRAGADKSNLERNLRMADERLDAFQPLKLVDDHVLIQPIEWTR